MKDILALPRATDRSVMNAIGIMGVLYPYVFLRGDRFAPLFTMKIIEMTLQYGITPWCKFFLEICAYLLFLDEVGDI